MAGMDLRTGRHDLRPRSFPWLLLRYVAGEWRVDSRWETREKAEGREASVQATDTVVVRDDTVKARNLLGLT